MKVTIRRAEVCIANVQPGRVFVHPWTDGSQHAYVVLDRESIHTHLCLTSRDLVFAVDLSSGQVNAFSSYTDATVREAEVTIR